MTKRIKKILHIVILWFLIFVLTLLFDVALGFLGYPSQWHESAVYPPNSKFTLSSIYEYECTFEFNSQGIRYLEIPLVKEDKNERRFFLVGDSYTEGQGVEADETFASILERYNYQGNNPTRFINGGVRGTGPLNYARTLDEVGFEYNIDNIIICIFGNDIMNCPVDEDFEFSWSCDSAPDGLAAVVSKLYPHMYAMAMKIKFYASSKRVQKKGNCDIVAEVSSEARKRGISEDKIAKWKSSLPEDILAAANRYEFNGALLSSGLLKPQKFSECLDFSTELSKIRLKNMLAIMDNMAAECNKRSISVYLVFIPPMYLYDQKSFNNDSLRIQIGCVLSRSWLTETTALQGELGKWANNHQVPFLDLTETFRKAVLEQDGPLNHFFDSHWTPLGHQVAADKIQEWLMEISNNKKEVENM